jgi:hypothetical protein
MMMIRKSLLLCKKQQRLFCHTPLHKKPDPNKIEKSIFAVALMGGIVGGGYGGVSAYNFSHKCAKNSRNVYDPLTSYSYYLIDTTIGTFTGMVAGFWSVYVTRLVLPIAAFVLPIAVIVAVARYLDPIESNTHDEKNYPEDYYLHEKKTINKTIYKSIINISFV